MHLEKNVSASILGFILGEKDTTAVRSDMTHAGISPSLHMRRQTSQNVYLKPHAPYTLKRGEIPKFMRRLAATETSEARGAQKPSASSSDHSSYHTWISTSRCQKCCNQAGLLLSTYLFPGCKSRCLYCRRIPGPRGTRVYHRTLT